MEASATTNKVPGLQGYPLVGILPQVLKDPLQFFVKSGRECGDISKLKVGPVQAYLVNHPDYIRHILQDNKNNYRKGAIWEVIGGLLGHGLPISEGDFWLRQRRLMQPAFHKQRLMNLAPLMTGIITETFESWYPKAQAGLPIDVTEEMLDLTLRVIPKTMFSTSISPTEMDDMTDAFNTVLRFINYRLWAFFLPAQTPFPGISKFRKAVQTLDRIVYRVIDERRQSGREVDDLLGMLLSAKDEETGQQMTNQQLRDEVLMIFLAGHETTAMTLSWTWYLLSQHPEVAHKLQTEVEAVLADRTPTFEDLYQLKYVRMVIEESMRVYPPVWLIPRATVADDIVGGYRIPAGSTVIISPYILHRHPTFWQDAEEFRPERFAPEDVVKQVRHSYLPFGAGPRQCIGNNFAMMEMQFILSMAAQRFTLNLVPNFSVRPKTSSTLRPSRGILMNITL